jgi:transcriptional regulator with XRE-family HTH domain
MEDRKGRRAARASPFGVQLSQWRARRQESQLSLALGANVSQRHLSFIETGRALPSRDMVLRLCDALDIPLRARNELLVSAGYAAFYPERPFGRSDMQSVGEALSRMIERHEPYPAFVVDREWRVVMRNEGAARFVSACLDERTVRALSADGALNLMRMLFEPKQMRPRIRNWAQVEPRLLTRLRREAAGDPLSPSWSLLRELALGADRDGAPREDVEALTPVVPLEITIGGAALRLFNTITTFGTPQDIGLQELRIELSFPADKETEAALCALRGAARRL